MDNLGNETIDIEYKVFNLFNIGLEMSNEDIETLIINKKWIFNNYIIRNIKSMINIYLSKYTCAYLSNSVNTDCILYLGVDDFGNVKGIPYQGILNISEIKSYFQENIKNNIKCEDNINILDYISFELIKLNYKNDDTLQTIHPYYEE